MLAPGSKKVAVYTRELPFGRSLCILSHRSLHSAFVKSEVTLPGDKILDNMRVLGDIKSVLSQEGVVGKEMQLPNPSDNMYLKVM